MIRSAMQVRNFLHQILLNTECVSSVVVAGEGDIFDPSELDIWIRESFADMEFFTPFQGGRTLSGKLQLDVFARHDSIGSMEELLSGLSDAFREGVLFREEELCIMTFRQRFTGTASEDGWIHSGVRISFNAW